MIERLFELLFKYRPLAFTQGDVRLGASTLTWILTGLVATLAIAALLSYARTAGRMRPHDRAVLAGLRLTALLVLLFGLLQPVLVLRAALPQQNFVAVLLDDSRSMQIADHGEAPRQSFIEEAFASSGGPLLDRLSDRFAVRMFRAASDARPVGNVDELAFTGTRSRLGRSLETAREQLAGLPVAGLILVSDGADTAGEALDPALLGLRADGIPVFTVAVGQDALPRDIQVSRVAVPRTVLKGSSLSADVVVIQNGYRGSTVTLTVEDEGRIVGTEEVTLPADGEPATVRISFTTTDAGTRTFRFRIPPQPDETVVQNNARDLLIDVRDRREKILYFEGEPRFEVGFIRRAVADDPNLQLVVLQRTAENKYLRLDIDDPDELAAGFPRTREELFAYRGLVLGSVEAGALTADQLRMIAEFVDRRGGGFLMLGGPRSFAEGGYAGTPVADILPVLLESSDGGRPPVRLKVHPTPAGALHAVTRLGGTDRESLDRWEALPDVSGANALHRITPGATALLAGMTAGGREHVVLAYQRFGRGKAMAFGAQDSWLWQLGPGIPVTDATHETFWRQLLRWLVDGVPGQVELTTSFDRVEPGDPITLTARVTDDAFVEANNARVVAQISGPLEYYEEVPMQWTGDRDGEYDATFVPPADGLYEVRVEASREGALLDSEVAWFEAGDSHEEYFDAAMRPGLLRRIAAETGGRYYTPETAAALPEDISYTGRGVTTIEERDLWDMPALLLLLVGLLSAEWAYRRGRGLP